MHRKRGTIACTFQRHSTARGAGATRGSFELVLDLILDGLRRLSAHA